MVAKRSDIVTGDKSRREQKGDSGGITKKLGVERRRGRGTKADEEDINIVAGEAELYYLIEARPRHGGNVW